MTNATAVTGSTDKFVTAKGAAPVLVKATVDDPAKVKPGSIKWSGGTAGVSETERQIATGSIGKIPVKTTAGGVSKTVTIHIPATALPAANPAAPRSHTKVGTANPGTDFGLTVVTIGDQGIKRPEFDVDAHIDGNKWAFRVRAIRHQYKVGVNAQGKKNVAVGAPSVKPASIAEITTDLTPPAAGTAHGPPRTKFWSKTITEAHEQAHVDRFYTNAAFWPAAMTRFETTVETTSVNFDPASAAASTAAGAIKAKKAAWETAVETEHKAADAAEIAGSEVAAHGVSNPMYTALLTAVRDSVVPPAPTGAAAVAGGGGNVTITWTATAANETDFVIERGTGKGKFVTAGTVGKAIKTFTDSGLPAGTKVTYQVRAKGAKGNSAASNKQTVTTLP